MTFLKIVSNMADDFFLPKGFRRQGTAYYRVKNDILQGVWIAKKFTELRIDVACIPYWNACFSEFHAEKHERWIHSNCTVEISSWFSDFEFDVAREISLLFDYFCNEVFSGFYEIDDFQKFYTWAVNAEKFQITQAERELRNYKCKTRKVQGSNLDNCRIFLYKAYLDGASWEDIKEDGEKHLLRQIEWLKGYFCPRYQFARRFSSYEDFIATPYEELAPREKAWRVLISILDTGDLSRAKESVDLLRNDESTLALLRKYFKAKI